ncbi:hypothetical protein A4A49_02246 [Nicotiana attenuata]|uniref:Uncharacterized protein n=1 Tax=Nicotiana attenuata TaxID=49451 RepID=A0A1J6I4C5_NICAT|nr:hypothetical protein A4A49_02246 [Nicotiana attenuata]
MPPVLIHPHITTAHNFSSKQLENHSPYIVTDTMKKEEEPDLKRRWKNKKRGDLRDLVTRTKEGGGKTEGTKEIEMAATPPFLHQRRS